MNKKNNRTTCAGPRLFSSIRHTTAGTLRQPWVGWLGSSLGGGGRPLNAEGEFAHKRSAAHLKRDGKSFCSIRLLALIHVAPQDNITLSLLCITTESTFSAGKVHPEAGSQFLSFIFCRNYFIFPTLAQLFPKLISSLPNPWIKNYFSHFFILFHFIPSL